MNSSTSNDYPSGDKPKKMPWEGSNRRSRLPKDWEQKRQQVKARSGGICEAKLQDGSRCPDQGTDCDHVVRGDNHEINNLQWLCRWHHRKKTAMEGNKRMFHITEKHPTERHPGLL